MYDKRDLSGANIELLFIVASVAAQTLIYVRARSTAILGVHLYIGMRSICLH